MRNSKFDAQLRTFCLIIGMAFRIFREPSFQDALLLEEHLMDTPEAGKGEAADDGGYNLILHQQGASYTDKPDDQPDPPGLLTPVILHFDDSRMAYADTQKNGGSYNNSTPIHNGRKGRDIVRIILAFSHSDLGFFRIIGNTYWELR